MISIPIFGAVVGKPHLARALVLFSWMLLALPLRAQEEPALRSAEAEPAGYRETIDEAVEEFAAHHFEEARALFGRAHALYPNARTHRGLGLAQYELRNYAESITQLKAALASEIRPLPGDLKAETEQLLTRAQHFVARVRADVQPANARLLLDGLPIEHAPGSVWLLPLGDHLLEVQAEGFVSERRKLSVQGGEEHALTIVLSRVQATTQSGTAQKRPWYKSPWLWTGVGVLVAGAAAGGAGYALSRSDKPATPYGGSADLTLKGP